MKSDLGYKEYKNEPSNPWLIFFHGFCEHSSMWEQTAAKFKSNYNCLLIDLPGFGASENLEVNNLDKVSHLISILLDNKNITSPILIGHSLGGYLALAYAKLHTNNVRALVLVHSTASADSDTKKNNRVKGINFLEQNGKTLYLKQFTKTLLGPNTDKLLKNKIEEMVNKGAISKKGIINALIAMKNRKSSLDFIAKTNLPILYYIGKNDEFIPYRSLHLEVSSINNGEYCFLENSSHLGFWEESNKYYKSLQVFLKNICN